MEHDRIARVCYGAGAVVAAVGGLMHGSAYRHVVELLSAAHMPPNAVSALEALWLGFAATLLAVAAVLAALAARPGLASRGIVWLIALIPAASAAILYAFLGNFIGGHVLAAVAALTWAGGWSLPRASGMGATKEIRGVASN